MKDEFENLKLNGPGKLEEIYTPKVLKALKKKRRKRNKPSLRTTDAGVI